MSIWQDFVLNQQKLVHKWTHYFPIYERHFAAWKNKSLTFLEIGVSEGGSLQMWQRYFGPNARIIGIDIDANCKQHEAPGIAVCIGHQADRNFLLSVIDSWGVPDIVLDDGSHQMSDVRATFDFLYPRMHKNAIYMVEDMHTAYWPEFGGGVTESSSFINFSKHCIDQLNADHTRGAIESNDFTRQTFAINFYDSLVCFEKGDVFWKEPRRSGNLK